MDELYRELILDHYKNPKHKGMLANSQYKFVDENPLCGDHLEIYLQTDANGVVLDAKFEGNGCAISMASADLLMESIIGKNLDHVKKLSKQDILEMLGIELSPVRLKCALLSLKVAKAAAYEMQEASNELVE